MQHARQDTQFLLEILKGRKHLEDWVTDKVTDFKKIGQWVWTGVI
jgi:hypothetical protein